MFKIYKNLFIYRLYTMQKQQIKLTQKEQKIFNMLLLYKKQMQLNTVLRVAGGWVRDKIMGKQSHDIDIALDNMMGQEFVTKLKSHAEGKKDKISGFGVTKFNPDLSKHLETATAQINDSWIDFVNLRSEQYNEDSRIPTIQIGTPKQDAQRRDFTINSMFYNLDTQLIEDWTEKGFSDLEDEILRTPLQPYVTFKDDPLRILRCLRFKARFNFKVQQSIYKAMQSHQIKDALLHKVSKQRVGSQLSGILKAKSPELALVDILKYELWSIVFEIPENSTLTNPQKISTIPQFSFSLLSQFIKSLQQNEFVTQKVLVCEQQPKKEKKKAPIQYQRNDFKINSLLSCLTYVYHFYDVAVGKTKSNLTTYMVKDQLKFPAKVAKFALHFSESVQKLKQIKNLDCVFPLIRWLRFSEQKWEIAIHLLNSMQKIQKVQPMISPFQIREFIMKNKLQHSYLRQAYVDGNYMKEKGIKGKDIRTSLENATIWCIVNPQKSEAEFKKQFQENKQFFTSDKTYY